MWGPVTKSEKSRPSPSQNLNANEASGTSKGIPHYHADAQIGFLLRRAYQRNAGIFLNFLAGSRLTPTQFQVMCRLYYGGTLSQGKLGQLAALDPATTQGIVQRLIARRLVARAPDMNDRRRRPLRLTPKGTDLIEAQFEKALKVSEATLSPLKSSEQKLLLELLKRIG